MSVPSSIDTIYYDILKKAIASVFTDAAISPYLMTGGTDALWYEKVSDQVFRFSPALMNSSELSRMHAKNERFSLKNLERGINFYHFLIKSM
jgi:carboxypeptidase PM20D1